MSPAPTRQVVTFDCQGADLIGILHRGDAGSSKRTGVLIIVGGPQYRVGSHRHFVQLADALAQAGYPAFRFDVRGMGDSDGEFPGFEGIEADIGAALEALRLHAPELSRLVLFGLCDAASASLLYCRGNRQISGLMLANPWVRTAAGEAKAFVQHYYWRRFLQPGFWAKVVSGKFSPLSSLRSLLGHLSASRSTDSGPAAMTQSTGFIDQMLDGAERHPGPILWVISGNDLTAREFEALCHTRSGWNRQLKRPGATVLKLSGADHTFSRPDDAQQLCAGALHWLEQLP